MGSGPNVWPVILKLIALAWFVGALAVIGGAISSSEQLWSICYLGLAVAATIIGFGLWLQQRWAHRAAILIGWLVLTAPVLFYAIAAVLSVAGGDGSGNLLLGATMFLFIWTAPIALVVLLQAFLLTRSAIKALFSLPHAERGSAAETHG